MSSKFLVSIPRLKSNLQSFLDIAYKCAPIGETPLNHFISGGCLWNLYHNTISDGDIDIFFLDGGTTSVESHWGMGYNFQFIYTNQRHPANVVKNFDYWHTMWYFWNDTLHIPMNVNFFDAFEKKKLLFGCDNPYHYTPPYRYSKTDHIKARYEKMVKKGFDVPDRTKTKISLMCG